MPVLTDVERVGTTIGGKYRLDRIIGRGGVGTVFAGLHAWTGREVAVKMLHLQHAQDPTVVDRFLTEARASATLRHPNVVDVLDMGQDDDGAVYMVLEYLEGESLSHRLERRRRLTPDDTTSILLPVMDALAEAHDAGIVHRDIKPENVFVSLDSKRRTVPKLLDFGIAKVLAAGSSRATRTGTVVGTPAYMSPEQADGRSEVGPASDVWSMGILFYECLSGVLPFPTDSPTATLVAILTTSPAPLRTVAPDVPVALARAVDRALSRAPEARWPDMRAFAAAVSVSSGGPAALPRQDPSGAVQPTTASTDLADARAAAPPPVRAVAQTALISPAPSAAAPRPTPATLHLAPSDAALPGADPGASEALGRLRGVLIVGMGAAAMVVLTAAFVVGLSSGSSDPPPPVVRPPQPVAVNESRSMAPAVNNSSAAGVPPTVPSEPIGQVPTTPTPESARTDASPALRPASRASTRASVEPMPETVPLPGVDTTAPEPVDDRPETPPRDGIARVMGPLTPQLRRCAGDLAGFATAVVVVRGDGSVQSAVVSGTPPFGGTTEGACMEATLRAARFPPFRRDTFRFSYPFRVTAPVTATPSVGVNDSIIID